MVLGITAQHLLRDQLTYVALPLGIMAKVICTKYAMHLLKKSCSKHITEYAPIVRVLCNMDDDTKSMIKKQFDIGFF